MAFYLVMGTAHAAQYGDSVHEHDGVACAIGVSAEDETGILPVPPVVYAPIVYPVAYAADVTSAHPYLRPQTRGSPRSPPLPI
ncbi:MAG: hypothetical protein ACPGVT_00450 [Maricaulaceae bacterium]